MGSSSPSLKTKLRCLLDPGQQRKRRSFFIGDLVKIQKVPPHLRQRTEFNKYYLPKVISIGPIHHPKGEQYKEMWATMYLQDKLKAQQQQQEEEEEAQKLLDSIRSEIQQLKAYYTEDVIEGLDDDELAWIFFLDGCATLHVMEVGPRKPLNLQATYKIAQQDLFLLENQLPYQVLRILSKNDDSSLKHLTNRFLKTLHIVPLQSQPDNVFENYRPQPAHLLDLLIKSIVPPDDDIKIDGMPMERAQAYGSWPSGLKTKKERTPIRRNIQELVTAGIGIKKINNVKNITSIYLSRDGFRRGGELYIPPLIIDASTAHTFMNMMAYEMCPDSKSKYEINNYVSFLNSLIDHAEDVKELKKAGVLNNLLGSSDEEVAQIFNTVSTDLVVETGIYSKVGQDIEQLYTELHTKTLRIRVSETLRIWVSELWIKHFNTPWRVIGLIAFILGLVGTIVNLVKELGPKKDHPFP